MLRLALVPIALLGFVACGQSGTTPPADACTLSLDGLAGTTWVMFEPVHGKGDLPNAQARGTFFEEGGKLRMKYSAKSMSDIYEYGCAMKGEELVCRQDVDTDHLQALCRAFEAHEAGSCSAKKLAEAELGDFSDEEVKAAIEKAQADAAEARKGTSWDQWAVANNNLGNKLQGRVYIKVDARKCRLRFSDMYVGIFNGKTFEDSNVVGTNPFVQETAELLFEDCDDSRTLLDWASADRPAPEDVGDRSFALGDVVHYHYYGDKAVQAEEGCTYAMDVWQQWRDPKKGIEAPVVDGKVDWHTTVTWTDGASLSLVNEFDPRGILGVVRYQTCGGAKTKIDTLCNAAKVTVPKSE